MPNRVVHVMVTEKPLQAVAYRVRDFGSDIDVNDEARNCAHLPGVQSASVEYHNYPGAPMLVVKFYDSEEILRINGGCWIVIRPHEDATHPMDRHRANMMDVSGRVMTYTDEEFSERYAS